MSVYIVTIEYEIPVHADNAAEAVRRARGHARDEDPVQEYATEVTEAKYLDTDMLGAIPWESTDDKNIAQILKEKTP